MNNYEWLKSDYGDEVHGFKPPLDAPYVEALCEHSAPPARLHPKEGGDRMCVACLILYGDEIPEGQEWQT